MHTSRLVAQSNVVVSYVNLLQTIIGTVMDEFRNGGAYVGTSPWAYGGLYRPETQHANEFGMVWAGDPPHESPG
jgi:mannan endo-1,4-beta-mannosidase